MDTPFSYLESAAVTDVGRRRKNNEDALVELPACGVFCVADGMGGAKGGEIASQATVEALQTVFEHSTDAPFAVTAAAAARLAARALNQASAWIRENAEERGLTGCGSTAVMLLFDRINPACARVLHAGDSRAYRLRGGRLEQLSQDHSVAAAAGLKDEKDLPAMFRGVITRAVGLEKSVRLEETLVEVHGADLYLLCSDGLSKMVSDRHIQKLLRKHATEPIGTLAQRLIDEALHAGGEDNISVILVRVADKLPPATVTELSPETLALEALDLDGVPAAADSEDSEPLTRDTRETADTAGCECAKTPRDIDTDQAIQTPPTPFSGTGITPEENVEKEEVAPKPRRRLLLRILVVCLMAGLAAAVWILFRTFRP
ncbi:MAG TPA: protein phosphatase 2C domain-containing protein [Kiritimatiellia bacterium]|jgi:serine/threonine protein phosphatase PrpC|nr:protein phosphatase 2C domain-containing protein [Kiritimatiellia bacterium]HOM59215.1 protein phosphatase 2C domain-containing protein [Kiritimatiellia bacterium]HOR98331.1 protein phosphatase 2C domain-containing protein [Kiritimatiellia bacterium]HPC49111.1 protein phosphatase 2C domain-containing protein [Kiritimatiellia bacterium]HPW75891.1 protein phosphatase 2C domain-containing protein [Kiritimatiellia bacterium]